MYYFTSFLTVFFNTQTSTHTLGSHLFSDVLLTFLFFVFTSLWRIHYTGLNTKCGMNEM